MASPEWSAPVGGEFRSCGYIEGNIMFNTGELNVCCIPLPEGRGNVKMCDYTGGELPMEQIAERRNELRRLNNTPGADSPCLGCGYLKKQQWTSDYPFNMLTVSHYTRCNLRCNYCYISDYTHEQHRTNSIQPYNIQPIIEGLLEARLLDPNASTCWGGGEPAMFEEFGDVLATYARHGVRLILLSNCTIRSEAVLPGIAAGTISVVCSVDAGTRATYKIVKGKDQFEKVWQLLAEYVRASCSPHQIAAKYIFQNDNYDDANVRGFIDNAEIAGIKAISIAQNMNLYNGSSSTARAPLPSHIVDAMANMVVLARQRGMQAVFTYAVFSDLDKARIRLRIMEAVLRAGLDLDVDLQEDSFVITDSKADQYARILRDADQQMIHGLEADIELAKAAGQVTELAGQVTELRARLHEAESIVVQVPALRTRLQTAESPGGRAFISLTLGFLRRQLSLRIWAYRIFPNR